MTTLLLIRHAMHDLVGRALAGRAPGVHLNPAGREQAVRLAEWLAPTPLAALYTSPRERAQETAGPIGERCRLSARPAEGLDEIDFGEWTGRSLALLAEDPHWPVWVERRSEAQPPGGESIRAVQERAVRSLAEIAARHPRERVAVVAHGDVIKAALAHFLGVSLDGLERFEISPASVSVLQIGADWSRVMLVNGTASGPA